MRLGSLLLSAGLPALALLAACDGCGTNLGLGATGARGYVRCLAAAVPERAPWELAGLRLRVDKRELVIEGVQLPLRIAAFTGAGFADAPQDGSPFDTIAASEAKLVIVLGGMGDTSERAGRVASRLAALERPVIFLAGGRDARDRYLPAIARHPALVDVTPLDLIRIGADTFVPLAGSADGRYALDDACCGYALPDLKQRVERLGQPRPGERRWLLSWEAPRGPLTRAPVETGNPDLPELAVRVGARGGLHGWPELHVGEPHAAQGVLPSGAAPTVDFALVVPRLWGPWQERADGERTAPGLVLLELSESGLRLISGQEAK